MLPSQLANVHPDKFCSTKITIMDYLWPNGEMILQTYSKEDRENISLQQLIFDLSLVERTLTLLPILEATKCLWKRKHALRGWN